jgi:hypothetical protein
LPIQRGQREIGRSITGLQHVVDIILKQDELTMWDAPNCCPAAARLFHALPLRLDEWGWIVPERQTPDGAGVVFAIHRSSVNPGAVS